MLFFQFSGDALGWPTLKAINKVKETTKTTLSAAVVQIAGLVILGVTGHFQIMLVASLKSFTEMCLMAFRLRYCWKYRSEFNGVKDVEGEK